MNPDSESVLVDWPKYEFLDDWLKTQPVEKWKEDFDRNGFLVSNVDSTALIIKVKGRPVSSIYIYICGASYIHSLYISFSHTYEHLGRSWTT